MFLVTMLNLASILARLIARHRKVSMLLLLMLFLGRNTHFLLVVVSLGRLLLRLLMNYLLNWLLLLLVMLWIDLLIVVCIVQVGMRRRRRDSFFKLMSLYFRRR